MCDNNLNDGNKMNKTMEDRKASCILLRDLAVDFEEKLYSIKMLINTQIDLLSEKEKELDEESMEYIYEKLNEYEMYLEYDCKCEFNIEHKKETIIEMIITFPSRKVPENKKGLEEFINRHIMDFSEYYFKINNFNRLSNDNLIAPI
jgi:hypothetical protein